MGGIPQTTTYAANKQLSELNDSFGKSSRRHDLTGEHEERNSHQRIVVGAIKHAGRNGHRIPHVRVEHEDHRAEHEHHGDGNTEAQKEKERCEKKKQFHTLSP